MKFLLTGFRGAIKQLQSKLLTDTVGVDSRNQNPVRGDLRPWHQPLTVATVPSGRKTIYRMGRDIANDGLYWLSWSTIVHAIRGFLSDDPTERTYYTGSGAPKVTDNTIGLASSPYPTTARDLGVPRPSTAVTLTQTSAGTGTDELRFYVRTFVTDLGEESAPSPAASLTCKPGAVIDIAGLSVPPAGNFGIDRQRIYRLRESAASTDYFLILEAVYTASTLTDNAAADSAATLVTNGPAGLVGRDWQMPPSDLKWLTAMWNGMLAGISGRSVRVCEPYKPYAWPPAYSLPFADITPVALAVWSKNLLVLTTGQPYLVNGSAPEALGDDPTEFSQACMSETSVAVVGSGAAWAAPDGLAYLGTRAPTGTLLTAGILSREDWLAMKPETIVGCQYEGAYMGFYEPVSGTVKGFLIDPANPTGLYYLDTGYAAAFFDRLRDSLYVLEGTNIRKWDAGAAFMTATYLSKVFRAPKPMNMPFMRVVADPAAFPVTVKVYSDQIDRVTHATTMVLRETRTIVDGNPVTLKGGYLSTDFQFEGSTSGNGGVQGIAVADSMQELAS
jgi:hypothetical protein